MIKLEDGELYDVELVINSLTSALRRLRRGQGVNTKGMYDIGDEDKHICQSPDAYLSQENLDHLSLSPDEACLSLAFLYGCEQGRRMAKERVSRKELIEFAIRAKEYLDQMPERVGKLE